eukprot:symbB.v1.2.030750.t1/scaffold3500.1/size56953/2
MAFDLGTFGPFGPKAWGPHHQVPGNAGNGNLELRKPKIRFWRYEALVLCGCMAKTYREEGRGRRCRVLSMKGSNEEIQKLLVPMIRPKRLERAKEVLNQRSQAVRLVFCCSYEADVTACLRTMDLFGIQFGEIIGDWTTPGDTSGGAQTYVTLRHWPDVSSCWHNLMEAGYKSVLLDNDASEEVKEGLKNLTDGQSRLAVFLADQRNPETLQELRNLCELKVHLPQRGFSRSLSLGVSVASLLTYFRSSGILSGDLLDEGQRDLLWTHWLLELRGKTGRKLLKEKGLPWPKALE